MTKNRITKQTVIALGLVALTFAPGITRAQSSTQTPAQDQNQAAAAQSEMRKRGVMEGLNLTEDQKASIKSIRENTKSKVDGVRSDNSLTADQKAAKVHELHRSARAQTLKLLTPEQRQQMRANIRAMRVARREKQQEKQPQAQPQTN